MKVTLFVRGKRVAELEARVDSLERRLRALPAALVRAYQTAGSDEIAARLSSELRQDARSHMRSDSDRTPIAEAIADPSQDRSHLRCINGEG